jgi:nucleoside-diphosphate-sugar epimerase
MDTVTKHHILLLGGTGICGIIFTRAALEAGHKLTLYVRTPSKIPSDLSSNTNLSLIQGELQDAKGLEKAASCGADIFISLAGPTLGKKEGTVRLPKFQGTRKGDRADVELANNRLLKKALPHPPHLRHL